MGVESCLRGYRDSYLPTNNLDELYNQELRIEVIFPVDGPTRFLSIIKVEKKMVSQRP